MMEPGTIAIPIALAFEVLEKLRLVSVYLDPPEDFKPEKWPTPQEYAADDLYPAYTALYEAMREQIPSRGLRRDGMAMVLTEETVLAALPPGRSYETRGVLLGLVLSFVGAETEADREAVLTELRRLEGEGKTFSYVSGEDLRERWIKVSP